MKIRIESNSLNVKHVSGIGYYTKLLAESLAKKKENKVLAFSFNFFKRQSITPLSSGIIRETNTLFPLRFYAKAQSLNVTPPFDTFLRSVDLTIFPNYARWPSIRSKVVATVIHDLTYIHYPELMEEGNLSHLKRVVPRAINESDFIITISEAIKSELIKEFSIDPSKIILTPIPPAEQFHKKNTNEVHKKYSINTEKYIFFISSIEPRKNIPLLVAAYSALPKDLRDTYSLVLSGGMGWKSEESVAAIEDAQRKGLHVVYTGYIDEADKSALYQKSSLFVMPSSYEGFGMPILEAIASKVPVVATDIPVLREAGGEGAVYFVNNDQKSLTKVMTQTLTDKSLRKELLKKAAKHLRSFSWEANATAIINKTNELLKK